MQDVWQTYGPLVITALVLAVGFTVVGLAYRVLRRVGRRAPRIAQLARRTHKPAQALVALMMAQFAVSATTDAGAWRAPLLHGMLVASIAAGGWLVASLLLLLVDGAQRRFPLDVADNGHARKAHTQLIVLRRVTVAGIAVITIGAALYTFPAVRGIGTSLLASAGLLGVVAGLAAQSTLGNLIAGLQIAFGDRLRIDDVVVVEEEWGRIEEITLGYVVVRIWDQRRLLLPTSYFTTSPFTSWSRTSTEILGTVELDVDWTVPVAQMRAELERYVADHPLWDKRAVSLQVTDATGALVRVRAVVSAVDGSQAWTLRCDVREHLIEWVRTTYPHALPRTRAELTTDRAAVPAQAGHTDAP